ncbi:circadian clock protein KaiA [Trichocoleus desertorum]|uniref:Circadian clock oscillator protein KaiA n=1 Tax=Trichocoleus desertorum GB2-A4 TaxID=2933944 RepID=A0ABV0J6I3_9CYAN|nr:circadian clock protein KaiA [Trichocoleus sp. FACHB-46]
MYPQLSISTLLNSGDLAQSLTALLSGDRYRVTQFSSENELFDFIELEKQQIDCLILQASSNLNSLVEQLQRRAILLPAVVLKSETATRSHESEQLETLNPTESILPAPNTAQIHQTSLSCTYHIATVEVSITEVDRMVQLIHQAIVQFLKLSPTHHTPSLQPASDLVAELTSQNSLMLQQRRLTEKLKERLGYLSVYYKREHKNFLRYLPPDEKQKFLKKLKSNYSNIVLIYFSGEEQLNQKIDDFVNMAFFADVSVSQIVEVHMELIDEFSKQLKLEGRSDDILLDYRLTLIDTIAHLCEMYRRSIPRDF